MTAPVAPWTAGVVLLAPHAGDLLVVYHSIA